MAIVAEAHPGRVRNMLVYLRLLVWEAQKYGGSSSIMYDQVFQRNRPGPEARWDQLDPSLHIAYVAQQADSPWLRAPSATSSTTKWKTVPSAPCQQPLKSWTTPPPPPPQDMIRSSFSVSVSRGTRASASTLGHTTTNTST